MTIYYEISEEAVELFCNTGKSRTVYYNENTGNVYYRVKFINGSDAWHPGLYIGRDSLGIDYYIHNNLKTGVAEVVTKGEFSKGLEICSDSRKCLGTPHRIVRMALARVVVGKSYRFRYYSARNIEKRTAMENADKLIEMGLSFLAGLFVTAAKQ
jgi:hypothetical protein